MKTTVNFYRFDISKEDQAKEYRELCYKLRDIGLKPFRTIRANYFQHEKFIKKLKSFDEIELDTDWITDDQWNTTENSGSLRVMDWNEDIVPNRLIKDGYWLTQTDEMKEIRRVTYKCGYCGKLYSIYNLPEKEICDACIGSQYLEQDNFDLLKLVSVVDKDNRPKLTAEERRWLADKIFRNKVLLNEEREKKYYETKTEEVVKECERKIENAEMERNGFMWFLSRSIKVENLIFYNHTNKFCYGWKFGGVSSNEKKQIEALTKDFPYPLEIRERK